MRKTILISLVATLAACGKGETNNDYKPGQTEFVTVEPSYSGSRGLDAEAAPTAGGAQTPTNDANKAPSGRTGTVEEADIYRIDGNRLFYFSTYRGFIVYDVTDTAHPTQVSRLPVYGYPVEMYVDGTTVYALIRDALYMTQDAAGAKFDRHDVSQLLAIDVSDAANPRLIKSIDIIGQLREGVSRKIDDTIYVVSYIPQGYYGWWWNWWGWYGEIDTDKEQAWVYSFNVANPADPQLVDKLKIFEGGGASAYNNNSSFSRYFQGVAISATSNTLHVVENWQTYGSVHNSPYNCGSYQSQQEAIVSIVDISNPSGAIRLHSKFDTYGQLNDQFKQTYVYDEATHKGYYYGIFGRQEWSSFNCQGSSFVRNSFEAWDVTDGQNPTRVGQLSFGHENETVSGTTFDTDRKVAYAVTAQRIDPFYAIGFSDPAHPAVLSEVDGLAGDMSVFRFIDAQKNFILGIGRDNTAECTGFVANTTRFRAGIAVSIFDVQNSSAIRLVQRKCVDVDGDWTSSDLSWNLDQAHKMIGQHSDGTANVVSVPVSYFKKSTEQNWWWYRYQSAVGLLSWDLALYNPALNELQQNVLQTRATVDHPNGGVRRSIVFTHQGDLRRTMINLSDTHVTVTDIQDLDAPIAKSDVEVAPNIEAIFKFGGFLVEQVRAEGNNYGYDTASEFRVKPVGGTIDETPAVASFSVGQVQRVMKWKDSLVIFRSTFDQNNRGWGGEQAPSQIVIYNLANPAAPQLSSVTTLPVSIYPNYWFWCGDFGYFGGWWWNGATEWASFDGGLAFSTNQYNYQTNTSLTQLVYINLDDLAAPSVKLHSISSGDQQVVNLTTDASDPGGFFLTYREQVATFSGPQPGYDLAAYKYYAQRWSRSGDDISADAATNLPGQIVRSWKSGNKTYLLAQNNRYTWTAVPAPNTGWYWDTDPRLHLLVRQDDSTASLLDSHTFTDRGLRSLVGDGDRIFVTTTKEQNYYYGGGVAEATVDSNGGSTTSTTQQIDNSDHLTIFDVSNATLDRPYDDSLGVTGAQAMGAQGSRLFLNVQGAGVLVVNVSVLSEPLGHTFLRTLGWGSHLEFSGSTLYVAAGNFGVFQKPLDSGSLSN